MSGTRSVLRYIAFGSALFGTDRSLSVISAFSVCDIFRKTSNHLKEVFPEDKFDQGIVFPGKCGGASSPGVSFLSSYTGFY